MGVKGDASEAELKKAYEKLLFKHFTYNNPGDFEGARKKFLPITNAYEVLVDPKKRILYDLLSSEGVRQHE